MLQNERLERKEIGGEVVIAMKRGGQRWFFLKRNLMEGDNAQEGRTIIIIFLQGISDGKWTVSWPEGQDQGRNTGLADEISS